MNEFENVKIKGIHISRYIASWIKSGGTMKRYLNTSDPSKRRIESYFADWLRLLVIDGERLTEEEVLRIAYFAENGKLELEHSAEEFIANWHNF